MLAMEIQHFLPRLCLQRDKAGHPMLMKPWHLTYCGDDVLKQLSHPPRHFHIKLWWLGSNDMDHGVVRQASCVSVSISLSLPYPLSLPILPTAAQLTTSNIYYYRSPCLLTINSRHPKNQIIFKVQNCIYFSHNTEGKLEMTHYVNHFISLRNDCPF